MWDLILLQGISVVQHAPVPSCSQSQEDERVRVHKSAILPASARPSSASSYKNNSCLRPQIKLYSL